jgi:hypothetical protein
MPQLLLVRIGANEQARDFIEEAVSKSKFSKETALFEVGSDGSTRVLAPGASRIVASRDDALSAMRTAEIILGLRPLTVFDAAAAPMYGAFGSVATVR